MAGPAAVIRSDRVVMPPKSHRIIVSVIGRDRVGIISNVSAVLAAAEANILDISQSVMEEFFVMIMMVDIGQASLPFEELKQRLGAKGDEMALKIDAQHEDVFKFMHRI
jgi:ACT domain-containing protein